MSPPIPILDLIGPQQVEIEQVIHMRFLQKKYGRDISLKMAYDRRFNNNLSLTSPTVASEWNY